MDLHLRFEFDSGICKGISIKNPPVVPREGEFITFKWEDFVKDPEELAKLVKFDDDDCFVANIYSRKYAKDYAEVVVLLLEEEAYYDYISGRTTTRTGRRKY